MKNKQYPPRGGPPPVCNCRGTPARISEEKCRGPAIKYGTFINGKNRPYSHWYAFSRTGWRVFSTAHPLPVADSIAVGFPAGMTMSNQRVKGELLFYLVPNLQGFGNLEGLKKLCKARERPYLSEEGKSDKPESIAVGFPEWMAMPNQRKGEDQPQKELQPHTTKMWLKPGAFDSSGIRQLKQTAIWEPAGFKSCGPGRRKTGDNQPVQPPEWERYGRNETKIDVGWPDLLNLVPNLQGFGNLEGLKKLCKAREQPYPSEKRKGDKPESIAVGFNQRKGKDQPQKELQPHTTKMWLKPEDLVCSNLNRQLKQTAIWQPAGLKSCGTALHIPVCPTGTRNSADIAVGFNQRNKHAHVCPGLQPHEKVMWLKPDMSRSNLIRQLKQTAIWQPAGLKTYCPGRRKTGSSQPVIPPEWERYAWKFREKIKYKDMKDLNAKNTKKTRRVQKECLEFSVISVVKKQGKNPHPTGEKGWKDVTGCWKGMVGGIAVGFPAGMTMSNQRKKDARSGTGLQPHLTMRLKPKKLVCSNPVRQLPACRTSRKQTAMPEPALFSGNNLKAAAPRNICSTEHRPTELKVRSTVTLNGHAKHLLTNVKPGKNIPVRCTSGFLWASSATNINGATHLIPWTHCIATGQTAAAPRDLCSNEYFPFGIKVQRTETLNKTA